MALSVLEKVVMEDDLRTRLLHANCGEWLIDEGPALIERSLSLNPNLGCAWHFSALAKAFLGEAEEAIERASRSELRNGREVDITQRPVEARSHLSLTRSRHGRLAGTPCRIVHSPV
jgi:hypothetical protein